MDSASGIDSQPASVPDQQYQPQSYAGIPKAKRRSYRIIYAYAITTVIIISAIGGFLLSRQYSTTTNVNCGPGNSCISLSQAISLFGSGSYKTYRTTDPSVLRGLDLYNNTTEAWIVIYNNTENTTFIEMISKLPNPQEAYSQVAFLPNHLNYNFTNATTDGMTYSLASGTTGENNYFFFSLFGYKGDEYTQVTYSGKSLPQISNLTSVIANDIT
jgi:hypothetical protein